MMAAVTSITHVFKADKWRCLGGSHLVPYDRKTETFSHNLCQTFFYALSFATKLCAASACEKASIWLSFSVVGISRVKEFGNWCCVSQPAMSATKHFDTCTCVCTSVLIQISRRNNSLSRSQIENLVHKPFLRFCFFGGYSKMQWFHLVLGVVDFSFFEKK